MRLLLTTTAMAFALGTANLSVASVNFEQTDSTHQLEIVLASNFDNAVSLATETETFYKGDFLSASNAKLHTLNLADLYSGEGAARAVTVRYVT